MQVLVLERQIRGYFHVFFLYRKKKPLFTTILDDIFEECFAKPELSAVK